MRSFDVNDPALEERMIAKNSLAFSFLAHMPIVPGHTLICPVRVVETSEELSVDELQMILELKQHVCQALKKALGAEGFNFAWNEGETAGQTVTHFHLHVVPRKRGDAGVLDYEPRKFLYRPGIREISSSEELQQVAKLVWSCLC